MRLARLLSRVTQLNKSLTVARFSGQSRVGEAKRGFPGLLEIATLAGPSGAFLSGIISAELHQLPADIGPIQEKKKALACSSTSCVVHEANRNTSGY